MQLITSEGPLPRLSNPLPGFIRARQIPFSEVYFSDAPSATLMMQEVRASKCGFWDYQFRFRRQYPLSLEVSRPRVLLHYMLSGDGLCLHKTGEEQWINAGHYYLFCVPQGRHDMSFPSGGHSYAQLELSPGLLARVALPQDMGQTIAQFLKEPGFLGIPLFESRIPETAAFSLAQIRAPQLSQERFSASFETTCRLLLNSFYEDLYHNLPPAPADESALLVKQICNYIDGPDPGRRTVSAICKKFLICATTLRDLFATHLHTTVREYMLQSRMQKAKNYLLTTNYSIEEIALMTGYEQSQSFSIAFKQVVGVSPSGYRRQAGEQEC